MQTYMEEVPGAVPSGRAVKWGLAAALIALFVAAMDSTVVGTLLPAIGDSLGRPALFPWLMSGFMVAVALVTPFAGALTDRHGPTTTMCVAIAIFALASAAAALAGDMYVLIAARVAQGIGGGMMIVVTYVLIAELYGPEGRDKMQGMLSGVWGLAAILGPLVGAGMTAAWDWRMVFWLNLPLCMACALCLFSSRQVRRQRQIDKVDLPSQLLFATFIVGLLLSISEVSSELAPAYWAVTIAAFAALAWGVRRTRLKSPLPTAFFKQRMLIVTASLVVLASTALYASVTLVPLYLHHAHAGGEVASGVVVMAAAVGWVVGAACCGWLLKRIGFRRAASLGSCLLLAGAAWLIWGMPSLSWHLAIVPEALIGLGIGFVATTTLVLAQNAAPAAELGSYTSTVQLLRNVGAALGINALAAIQLHAATSSGAGVPSNEAFIALAAAAAACIPLSLMLRETGVAR
jgi:MFS family permease